MVKAMNYVIEKWWAYYWRTTDWFSRCWGLWGWWGWLLSGLSIICCRGIMYKWVDALCACVFYFNCWFFWIFGFVKWFQVCASVCLVICIWFNFWLILWLGEMCVLLYVKQNCWKNEENIVCIVCIFYRVWKRSENWNIIKISSDNNLMAEM